jgi:Mn2+/Fe2+ NRAMP family transporter
VKISKALRPIRTALSLARVVAINLVGLAVALGAAVHVHNRETNRRPAPIARAILAAHPAIADASSAAPGASGAASPWLPVEIELLDDVRPGSDRAPASPGVNDANRR